MTEEEIAELKENSKGFPKGKMHGKCPMGKGFHKKGRPELKTEE